MVDQDLTHYDDSRSVEVVSDAFWSGITHDAIGNLQRVELSGDNENMGTVPADVLAYVAKHLLPTDNQ